MDEGGKYTRVKVKCLICALHFIVCSWHPERHDANTLYCPECGQHDGRFMVWREDVEGLIYSEVPGNHAQADALPTAMPGGRRWWRFWRSA
jgi:hypothetical protein